MFAVQRPDHTLEAVEFGAPDAPAPGESVYRLEWDRPLAEADPPGRAEPEERVEIERSFRLKLGPVEIVGRDLTAFFL
ncbi:hypothetical protein GCM10008171_32950 [Methylopila jiangsuensis]|uniref:Uncharacterized protein n=1 Tax=Methylopila jiangsuensis TaxID=586230 RepID=A0A9W6N5A2_9HYPH|nr:hypothetical protein GCM10008171_32950 [Methylopila jiangsuensis]